MTPLFLPDSYKICLLIYFIDLCSEELSYFNFDNEDEIQVCFSFFKVFVIDRYEFTVELRNTNLLKTYQ